MDFGSLAVVIQKFIVHVVYHGQVTKFFNRGALKVVVVDDIFDNFACWILLVVKEAGECNPRRNYLLSTPCLLLILPCLVTLFLFLLAF